MALLENKVFKNLLDQSVIELEADGELILYNTLNEHFFFRYHAEQDMLYDAGIHLSKDQAEQVAEKMYQHHLSQTKESLDAFNTPNYSKEYGIDNQMFI